MSTPAPLGEYSVTEFTIALLAGVLAAIIATIAAAPLGLLGSVIAGLLAQQAGHLLTLGYFARSKKLGLESFGFDVRGSDVRFAGLGVLLQIGLALIFAPLTKLLLPEGSPQMLEPIIADARSLPARVALGFSVALLGPVTEELLFRGALIFRLRRIRGTAFALIVSSIVFSALHVASLNAETANQFVRSAGAALPQLLIVGLILGWLALRNGRIGPSIFTHVGFNLLGVIFIIAGDRIPLPGA